MATIVSSTLNMNQVGSGFSRFKPFRGFGLQAGARVQAVQIFEHANKSMNR
jgi:hypothetical protein